MAKKRNNQLYPGLDKSKNLKIRQEVMDQDYIHKLNNEEKDWLDRFNREFNNAEFNHGGKVLHKTNKLKKSCNKRNNDRNADEYSLAKAQNKLINTSKEKQGHESNKDVVNKIETANKTTNLKQTEDIMVSMIDIKNRNEREALQNLELKPKKRQS